MHVAVEPRACALGVPARVPRSWLVGRNGRRLCLHRAPRAGCVI